MKQDYTLLRQQRSLTTTITDPAAPTRGGAHFWLITEPTITQVLNLRRRLQSSQTSAAVWLIKEYAVKHWLKAGQEDTITIEECDQVLSVVLDMADQQVLKPIKDSKDEDKDKEDRVYDLPLLRALDLVGKRYGMLPQDLARRITHRQLYYLYYLAYNAELDDQEIRIALAGGKVKDRAPRLELIDGAETQPEGRITAGMTVTEKAAYFSRQRRAEGREPGRV